MNTILPCYFRHPLFVVFAVRVEECFEVAGTVEAAECFISRCHSLKIIVWPYYIFFYIHLFHISLKNLYIANHANILKHPFTHSYCNCFHYSQQRKADLDLGP